MDFGDSETLAEEAAVLDETVLERYLETGEVSNAALSALIAERKLFPCYFGSALRVEGVDALLAAIEKALGKGKHRVRLCIPYSDGAVLDMLHREAQIESTDYAAEGTVVEAVVDDKTCGRVSAYIIDNE